MKKRIKYVRKEKGISYDTLTIPKEFSLRTNGVTQTMIGTFDECRMKWLLSINKVKQVGASQTFFGSVVHDILEKFYKQKWTERTLKTKGEKSIISWIDEYFNEFGAKRISGVTKDYERLTKIHVEVILTEYIKHYKQDFLEMRFEQVEGEFAVDFRGVTLRGKKDGRYRDRKGHLWVVDHKTMGSISESSMLLRLSFDLQMLMYILADEIEYGEEVYGCLYNVIRRPTTNPRKDESFNEYKDRLRLRVQTEHEKDGRSYWFKRYDIAYTKKDRSKFLWEFSQVLFEMSDVLSFKLPVRRKASSCEIPYRCKYLEACATRSLNGYDIGGKLFPELSSDKVVKLNGGKKSWQESKNGKKKNRDISAQRSTD